MELFLTKVFYFYILAFVLAILEIQIEGPHGWAEKLPTWRPSPENKLVKVYKKLMSQKEFTGYHFFMNILLLLFIHLPFVWGVEWNVFAELEVLGIFFLFVVVWDFLWFVLNPHFSLRDFKKEGVWWHKKWTGWVPTDYFFGIAGSVILLLPETIFVGAALGIYKIVALLGINLALTILTVVLYPKAY